MNERPTAPPLPEVVQTEMRRTAQRVRARLAVEELGEPLWVDIDNIIVGERFRKDVGDLEELAKSIEERGLLHPIVIDQDVTLIAGLRRLKACERRGWRQVPVRRVFLPDRLLAELDENTLREGFRPSEAVAIAEALEERLRAAARTRQLSGLLRGQQRPVRANVPDGDPVGRVRDRLGRFVDMGGKTLQKAREIVAAARHEPERFGALVEKMDQKGTIDGVHRKYLALREASAARPAEPAQAFVESTIWTRRLEDLLPTLSEVDAIITAPFLPPQHVDLYDALARLAPRALKPMGLLAIMCPNVELANIVARVTPHVPYRRSIAYLRPNRIEPTNDRLSWNPVLVFSTASTSGLTVVRASDKPGDRCDDYGRSVSALAALVASLTPSGGLVCDPLLAGDFKTALASARLGRRFVGCDLDRTNVKRTQDLVAEAAGSMAGRT